MRGVRDPVAQDVRQALERTLAHPPFDRSPVLGRFLTHVVEHALHTGAPPLKEYAIGLEVFGRGADFDPRVDTIVRVQARRLRQALASYYENHGRDDPWRLQMPKGHYGIEVRRNDAAMIEGAGSTPAPGGGHRPAGMPLPVARTALIGRENDLAQLLTKLQHPDTRLLTITGVGGIGKTRLALAAAHRLLKTCAGGVLFFDFSSVTRRQTMLSLLADAFEARNTSGRPLEEALAQRVRVAVNQPLLMVLDSMETVLEGADVLGQVLDANAQVKMLVTSRIALKLYGETEWALAPLALPGPGTGHDGASLSAVPAMKLFLLRAAAAHAHGYDTRELDTLAELCRRLDGLPLAIELVAAQAATLSPRQMLERFTGHLDLPSNPARDAPSRQRTLRRVIDWSHDLLDDPARIVLRRLSVFAGGFTLEAAEAVVNYRGDLDDQLLPAISQLVALGLVHRPGEGGQQRLAMLETLRAYGRERLNASDETDPVRKAHVAYCVVLAEEGLGNPGHERSEAWLARCDEAQDNFREALQYVLHDGPHVWALRLGQALFVYWERREKFIEARRWIEAILETVPEQTDTALWAKLASYAATLAGFQNDAEASNAGFRHALELYRRLDDKPGQALALNALGVHARAHGKRSVARGLFLQSLELCRQIGGRSEIAAALSNLAECDLGLGNQDGVKELLTEAQQLFVAENDLRSAAWCTNHLGDLARAQGDRKLAEQRYQAAEEEFARLGDNWGQVRSLLDRGRLALDGGDCAKAIPLLQEALAGYRALNHQRGMAMVADSTARLALASGDPRQALRLLAAAEAWRSALGFTAGHLAHELARRSFEQAVQGLDESTIEKLRHEGWNLSAKDVLAYLHKLAATVPTRR